MVGVAGAEVVVAMGDLNESGGFPALNELDYHGRGHMVDLGRHLLPPGERGSFVFGPNSLDLDHILVGGKRVMDREGRV